MNAIAETQELEQLARNAHEQGVPWGNFWADVQKRVDALEPFSLAAWHRLHRKLMRLLVCGDGQEDEKPGLPWIEDDVAKKA